MFGTRNWNVLVYQKFVDKYVLFGGILCIWESLKFASSVIKNVYNKICCGHVLNPMTVNPQVSYLCGGCNTILDRKGTWLSVRCNYSSMSWTYGCFSLSLPLNKGPYMSQNPDNSVCILSISVLLCTAYHKLEMTSICMTNYCSVGSHFVSNTYVKHIA